MADVMERETVKLETAEIVKKEKFTPFDPAKYLETEEDFAYFMADAFETQDVVYIAHALGIVARAKGMAQIAKETGLSREQLYKSFSERGNPTLKSTLAVMKALGVGLTTKTTEQSCAYN